MSRNTHKNKRRHHQQKGGSVDQPGVMPVSQSARHRGGQRARHSKQAKQSSHVAAIMPRQVGQMENQSRPENTESAKPTGANDGVPTQYRLAAHDIPKRGQQLAIMGWQLVIGSLQWQTPSEQNAQAQHQPGAGPIHSPPTGGSRKQTAEGARQQNAHQ